MTLFLDYTADGKLIGKRDEPISERNFDRFQTEHGSEKAVGYLQAIADVVNQIEQILHRPISNGFMPNTPTMIRRELEKFHIEKNLLLQSQNFLSESQNNNTQLEI